MKIVLYLSLLLCITSCNTNNDEELLKEANNATLKLGVSVDVSVIKPVDFNKQVIANGKVVAGNKSELRFKLSNRLASIKVKNGSKVSKNQIIASIDNELLEIRLNKAKIDFNKAEIRLREEIINYGLDTIAEDRIPPFHLENLKLKSGIHESKNQLIEAQALYEETFLRAPFDGVIANLNNKKGDFTSSNEIFCTVLSNKILEVNFSIIESEFEFVKKGQVVEIMSFINENDFYKGLITEINPRVDKSGLIHIRAEINEASKDLIDGMNVKVIINHFTPKMIVIPKSALVLRSNREVVFSVDKGLAKWNYVEILEENSTNYAISKGLVLNDTIIISGNMNLAHDSNIIIKNVLN